MTGTVREYLYAGGEAMRARQSDGSYANYFFVTNTHGYVVGLTDRDGVIVNRYAYGPWARRCPEPTSLDRIRSFRS